MGREEGKSKDYVEEMVAIRSGNAVRHFIDVTIITIIIVLIVAEVFINVYKLINNYGLTKSEEEIQASIEDARWLNEQAKRWEKLFAEGEYDILVEEYNEAVNENRVASEWKHEYFVYEYNRYIKANNSIDEYLAEGSTHSVRTTTNLLYNTGEFVHGYDFLAYSGTQKEKDVIEKRRVSVTIRAHMALGISEEDYEVLLLRLGKKGESVSYTKCNELAKEMVGEK